MRACFADNAEVPMQCSHDLGELYNCVHASAGGAQKTCPNWQPDRAVKLALEILGVAVKSP